MEHHIGLSYYVLYMYMLCTAIAVHTCSTWYGVIAINTRHQFDKYSILGYFNGWLPDANSGSNAGRRAHSAHNLQALTLTPSILNNLLDMSTRSRAPNGRFATTNATTDPTGGGGQADTEPDLSANTETEPPVDQGAAPDPGHLAGQGGEGAGTDTESSTEPFQDGSGSDDEEDLPTDKDQSDPAKAFRKAAEDGIRDWLGTVTSKDEMGTPPGGLAAVPSLYSIHHLSREVL